MITLEGAIDAQLMKLRKTTNKGKTMRTCIRSSSVLFILSTLAFLGIFEASSQAGRPPLPPGAPTIVLSGAIIGTGRATAIRVTFDDKPFGNEAGSFIANPDYAAAVIISGANRGPTTLKFYYCDSPDHDRTADLVCNDPSHSPHYYKCLRIQGGIPQPRSNQIIFKAGNLWDISWKETMSDIAQGTLQTSVSYDVLK